LVPYGTIFRYSNATVPVSYCFKFISVLGVKADNAMYGTGYPKLAVAFSQSQKKARGIKKKDHEQRRKSERKKIRAAMQKFSY
jgi:hypothetical protein